MFPPTLETGSFGAGRHLGCSSPGSSAVHSGSIGIHWDGRVIVASRGVGGVVLGSVSRLWVLARLVSPIPSETWVVGARIGRRQFLFEHFCDVVVVFYDLDQFCDVFLERVRGRGTFDLPGHSNGESQDEESFDVSFADVISRFSSQRSEFSDVLVHVVPFQLQSFQGDHCLGFPLRILEACFEGRDEVVPDISVLERIV